MQCFAKRLTKEFLEQGYITVDQCEWCQYMIIHRLMDFMSYIIFVPVGALLFGWIESAIFMIGHNFLRQRTGGFHAKTSMGCFVGSFLTVVISMGIAQYLIVDNCRVVFALLCGSLAVLLFSPANHPELHLSKEERCALRPRILVRTLVVDILALALVPHYFSLAASLATSVLIVGVGLSLFLVMDKQR